MGTNEARPVRHMRCVYTSCIATRFEWDDEKNRINKRKHGSLEFETAALVFNDPLTLFPTTVFGFAHVHAFRLPTDSLAGWRASIVAGMISSISGGTLNLNRAVHGNVSPRFPGTRTSRQTVRWYRCLPADTDQAPELCGRCRRVPKVYSSRERFVPAQLGSSRRNPTRQKESDATPVPQRTRMFEQKNGSMQSEDRMIKNLAFRSSFRTGEDLKCYIENSLHQPALLVG